MKEYLSFRHISVETQTHQQNLIDRSLGEAGLQRRVAVPRTAQTACRNADTCPGSRTFTLSSLDF
jgi:hypothetical protein